MRQIEYLLELALLDDEEGRRGQAEKTYTSAVELAIKAVREGECHLWMTRKEGGRGGGREGGRGGGREG